MTWLLDLRIETPDVLVPVYWVAGVLLLGLLLPLPGVGARLRRWWPAVAAAAGLGALAGSLLVWLVVDVQDAFGTPASTVIRGAAALAGAGLAVAVANLVRTRLWRKAVAIVALPAFVLAGALAINRDVAYFPRLGDALGAARIKPFTATSGTPTEMDLAHWRAPAGMPSVGSVGTITIPGTDSHWRGRPAWVYVPPAGRVAHPPRLPVLIVFSGEPGGPSDVFIAGGLASSMDAIARAHHGVAPVVVAPDQLGSYAANPECVDSKLGDVETYVTQDVRRWTLQHLPVSTDRRSWTVAGFSQGGTCAVQFGTAHASMFGSYLAVSPELGPISGTVARSVQEAFGGSRARYEAAQPERIMRLHRPYRQTFALYAVGARDVRYGRDAPRLAAASRAAGMRTQFRRLPGLAHNWNTGSAGLTWGIGRLAGWWGLP